MNKDLLCEYFEKYLIDKFVLQLISYELKEVKGSSDISIKLLESSDCITIDGSGVGLADSAFDALLGKYSSRYTSLTTIDLSDLYFQIDHGADRSMNFRSKTDIKVEFLNAANRKTCFSERTTSIGFTTVSVLTKAVEFYINSELLFKRIKYLIQDAKDRGRSDIAAGLVYDLSKVVEVTSYQDIT